jgi:hypothetical protein
MGIDVKRRVESMLSHGVTQQEMRRLRNEMLHDEDGATQAELNDLRGAFELYETKFKRTGALEVKRVLGLGVVPGAEGKGAWQYQPYSGIDTTAKLWTRKWGVKDQFDSRFPTYEKNLEDPTAVPAKLLSEAKKIGAKEVRDWHRETHRRGSPPAVGHLDPAYARAIYDLDHNLVGYSFTFQPPALLITTEVFIRLDDSKKGFKVVGSRWNAID